MSNPNSTDPKIEVTLNDTASRVFVGVNFLCILFVVVSTVFPFFLVWVQGFKFSFQIFSVVFTFDGTVSPLRLSPSAIQFMNMAQNLLYGMYITSGLIFAGKGKGAGGLRTLMDGLGILAEKIGEAIYKVKTSKSINVRSRK